MACKMCLERGKTWEGSDPVCFLEDHNWNCATANAIRDICDPHWREPETLPFGVKYIGHDDTNYALILVWDIDFGDGYYEDDIGGFPACLYVQWYKERGATEALWMLGEGIARKPTEHELLKIIEYYKQKISELQH